MSFLRKVGSLSLINISTAAVSLIWIPTLISFLGLHDYGSFILATTIASISYSILYINSWQWLLIKFKDCKFGAINVPISNDIIYTFALLTLALQVEQTNNIYHFISAEYIPILESYMIGFSISHLSIYTAFFRSKNKFTPPALVALASEIIKAVLIVVVCTVATQKKVAIDWLGSTLWAFGIPHVIANIYCTLKLRPRIFDITKSDLNSFLRYNCYLHPKNISDLLINHFDKIIININLGSNALAVYDLLKKLGYALSKLLSPVYPVVFGDLVTASTNKKSLRDKLNKQTKYFTIIAIAIYALFELALQVVPALPLPSTVTNIIYDYETEITLYIICHLLGFAFCSYHLILSALGKTKIEFYITTIANLMFVAAFYLVTKHSLLLGIFAILLQYTGLILAKAWMTKKII